MRPNYSQQVDEQMILITVVSIFLLVIIMAAMIYFAYRYDKKRNPVPEDISGNTTLEVIWTIVPILLVLVMFFYGWKGFENMRSVPENAMVLKVNGMMWKWAFEYPNGKKSDTLTVPINIPIKMDITSTDVNHSFFIRKYRIKEDAIPGRVNYIWFMPDEIGKYDISCAEYCGMNHSYMYAVLNIVEQREYDKWVNTMPAADTTAASDTTKVDNQSAPGTGPDSTKTQNPEKEKDTLVKKEDSVKVEK